MPYSAIMMSSSTNEDIDHSTSSTTKKRAAADSRKHENSVKKAKTSADMDGVTTEQLLGELRSRFEDSKSRAMVEASQAQRAYKEIDRLRMESQELRRTASERAEKVNAFEVELEVAEDNVEVLKDCVAKYEAETKASSSVIQAKLLQVAALEKENGKLTLDLKALERQREGQGKTLKVVEAAHVVKEGMTETTIGQFGKTLDGLRQALQAREEYLRKPGVS